MLNQHSNTPNVATHVPSNGDRDAFIAAALKHAEPMLENLARDLGKDYEDLYQDAAELLLKMWRDGKFVESHVPGYAQRAIKMEIRNIYVRRFGHTPLLSVQASVSLDAPLSEDSALCLGDLLSAPQEAAKDEDLEDYRIKHLYGALWELRLEEQQYIRRVYQLNAFEPRWVDRSVKPDFNRSANAVSKHSHSALRRDKKLKEVLVTYSHGL